MRAFLTALCRLLMRIFFRRVDVIGAERVPDEGPVLYVLNHPNGLLDPLFILCLSPRPVVFLAKAPLFHTFVVKHFVRGFECLPVYRTSDGEDPSKNRASIEASIALLGAGRALALFPEGKTHNEPWIEPLKTGAARIALASSASAPSAERRPTPVQIVPVGIDYSDKARFRSHALLVYGEPIVTPSVELDADFRPPNAAAEQLTQTIAEALNRVTLQAREQEAIELARDARRIWAASERDLDPQVQPTPDDDDESEAAETRFALEYRLLAGHAQLRERAPEQLGALIARIHRYQAEVGLLGLTIDQPVRQRRRELIRELLILPPLAPLALLGTVVHLPAWHLIDWIARRMAKQADEVLATIKLTGGLLFFPATWILMTLAVAQTSGWRTGLVTLLVWPVSGYAAMRFRERTGALVGRVRALWILLTRRDVAAWLVAERAAIRTTLLELAARIDEDVPTSS